MNPLLRLPALLLPALLASTAWAADENVDLIRRGEYLTRAADCIACHTADKSRPFAGGYALQTPLGTLYGSNITPDKETGIGNWSDDEFYRALHEGIGKDGRHLYPAMPYSAYTKLSRDDVLAIKAYLFSQPAVRNPVAQTGLSFPFNQRWAIAAWKAVNFTPGPLAVPAGKDVQWTRGAYLAEALGHCQECHTPRTATFGLSNGKRYAGGEIDGWQAYNITADPVSGIGSWSDQALLDYLRTGSAIHHGQAAGPMAEVVENSLRHLEEADLRAMLRYLREIPAIRDSRDSKPRIAWGNPAGDEARLRGTAGVSLASTAGSAAELYSANCASCHGASGQGSEDGYYPALQHNSTLGAPDPSNLIQVLLHGVTRDDGKEVHFMPAFGNTLDDAELAQLANYTRNQFGNAATPITGKDIGQRRAGNAGKPWLLQAVLVGAILVLLAVLALLLRPRRRKPVRIDIDV